MTISEIVSKVVQENPRLVEAEKQRLIGLSLAHIARQVLHAPTVDSQLGFPLAGIVPNIPPRIPVRQGPKNGPALWVELDELTFEQLDNRISELSKPSTTHVELNALLEFRDLIAPYRNGKSPSSQIGPAIKKLIKQGRS